MLELDKFNCMDCRYFQFVGTERNGQTYNVSGEGKCVNPILGYLKDINYRMTARQVLEKFGLYAQINNFVANDQTCYEHGGLEFSDEEIEVFIPTEEERRQWLLEDLGILPSTRPTEE